MDLINYQKIKSIGKGGFAEVFEIKEKVTGKKYAAKIFSDTINMESINEILDITREINIMARIEHPCILKFIGYSFKNFSNENNPVIITKFAKRGPLSKIIADERSALADFDWDDTTKFIVIFGIALGMSFLHENDIIHRDLKPSNILLTNKYYPKIADFGFSKDTINDINSRSIEPVVTIKGTITYLAPEIFKGDDYTKASDVYAFGIILYEIITNKIPYENTCSDENEFLFKILNGLRPVFPNNVPKSYRDLIERCWNKNPSDRPEFHEIVDILQNSTEFAEFNKSSFFDDYIMKINDSSCKYEKEKELIKIDKYCNNIELKLLETKKFILNGFEILNNGAKNQSLLVQKNGKKFVIKQLIPLKNEDQDSYVKKIQIMINDCSKVFLFKGISFKDIYDKYIPYPYIIQEYEENGTLENLIESSKHNPNLLTDINKMIILYGIAQQMLILHNNSIIYQNLMPKNILINKAFHPYLRCFNEVSNDEDNERDILFKNIESSNEEFDHIRSYGMIMFYILTSNYPDENFLSTLSDSVPSYFALLITSLFEEDPKKMLKFSDIVKLFDSGVIFPSIINDNEKLIIFSKYVEEFTKKIDFNFENIKIIQRDVIESSKNYNVKSIIESFWLDGLNGFTDNYSIVYKIIKNNKTAEIIKSPKAKGKIVIPSSIKINGEDYDIIKICDKAFYNTSITSINFEQNSKVKNIGNFVFENSELTSISLPEGLVELGKYWCGNAKKLSYVVVDTKNTHFSSKKGILFYTNSEDSNELINEILYFPPVYSNQFNVPEIISKIGSFAFYYCSGIRTISFKNTRKIDIGDYGFYKAKDLESIDFHSNELYISDHCFENCSSLSSISFGNVKNIKIGINAFSSCNKLQIFTLNCISNINIGLFCFTNASLQNVNLYCADNLLINDSCFDKCSLLETICFTNSDKSQQIQELVIGKKCFNNCVSLSEFNCKNVNNIKICSESFNGCEKIKIVSLIKAILVKLEDKCFSEMRNLKQLIIQSQSIHLPIDLFNENQNLTNINININEDLTINNTNFESCKNLRNITLSSNSKLTISNNSFNKLFLVEKIELIGKTVIIENNCFNECTSGKYNYLTKYIWKFSTIKIKSNTLVKTKEDCFNKLLDFTSVEIIGENINIGDNNFNQCFNDSSYLTLKSSVISIGSHCFNECENLSNISFLGIKYIRIRPESFDKCFNINELKIEPSLPFRINDYFGNDFTIKKYSNYYSIYFQDRNGHNDLIIDISNSKTNENQILKQFFKRLILISRSNYSTILPITDFGFIISNNICVPATFRKSAKYHSLEEFLRKRTTKSLTGTQKYIILLGLTYAIKFLHSFKIESGKLTLSNILLDTNYYPNISDFNYFFKLDETDNYLDVFKNDIYFFSLIAYELITGKIPDVNRVDSNILNIANPKIQELFKRLWLNDKLFIPSIDDIFEEMKNEYYRNLFQADDIKVCDYLQLLEKVEANKNNLIQHNDNIIYNFHKNDKTCEIISSSNVESNIFIPKYVIFQSDKFIVKKICSKAFSKSSIITLSFSLNSMIEKIDNYAFENSKIKEIYLNENLVSLGKYWCGGADHLSKIGVDQNNKNFTMTNNILYYVNHSENANSNEILFVPRNWSDEFKITANVTRIRAYAFYKCNRISSVVSDINSLTVIDEYSFYQCDNLESITLQEAELLNIEPKSFYSLNKLASIAIKCNELMMKENWINDCPSIDMICLDISNDFSLISKAFNDIKSLSTIKVKSGKKLSFNQYSFRNLENLKTLEISGYEVVFKYNWINNCPNLKSINIHISNDLQIVSDIFNRFDNIDNIKISSNSSIMLFDNCNYFAKSLQSVKIVAPKVNLGNKCFKSLPSLKTVKIKCNELIICNECFMSCESLNSIAFKNMNSIKIGEKAFANCLVLNIVNINESMKIEINDNCFMGSTNINSIIFKSEEVLIDKGCFMDCRELSSITFENVKYLKIGGNAFKNCIALKNVELVAITKIEIDDSCFTELINLNKITFRSEEVIICNKCFMNCSNLSLISFDNVKKLCIGSNLFQGCKKLIKIDLIASEAIDISDFCFCNLTNIQSIKLKSEQVNIGCNCFDGCNNLNEIIFEDVQNVMIGIYAFNNCYSLVDLRTNVSSNFIINNECFCNSSLQNVDIACDFISIGSFAFKNCSSLKTAKFTCKNKFISFKAFDDSFKPEFLPK